MTNWVVPLGDTLTHIYYDLLSWEEDPSINSLVDEVAMTVTLQWKCALPTRVTWSRDAEIEGLVQRQLDEEDPGPQIRLVDVSKRWSNFIGERLTGCTFSHSVSPNSLPWAANFQFSSGSHLVLALGEFLQGEPSYIPDSILVIASRKVAMSYHPPAAVGTAWADDPDATLGGTGDP